MRGIMLKSVLGLGILASFTMAAYGHGHGGFGGQMSHPGMHGASFHPMQPTAFHPHPGIRTPSFQPGPSTPRVQPSNRAPFTGQSSRGQQPVPSSRPRRPGSLNLVGAGSGRTPTVTKSARPNRVAGFNPNRLSSGKSFRLDNITNTNLINAEKHVGPRTQKAILDGLEGKHLSSQDLNYLKGALKYNTRLTATQKAAIASLLQSQHGKGPNGGSFPGGGNNGGGSSGCGGDPSCCNGGGSGGCGGDPFCNGSVPCGGDGSCPVTSDGAPVVSSGGDSNLPPATDDGSEPAATDSAGGIRLTEVAADGPAGQAGLRAGDVILSFGGVQTSSFADLQNAVSQANGESEVIFISSENGQTESLKVQPEDGRIGVSCE